ncbi:succinate--CoA ligase subunit alpha [Phosphitispora fastidiosa]|uniref:succinate--CoA ligase subunit alpha n=1 Tax=Phosphitispora fastidiosa TaxID=2837202 RepID=UPI001E35DC57|nr:succinyl-CoA synthetase alpha subunit [Phosphitispora fastidiosa]
MAIIIDENTRVLIQGITGNQGRFHTEQMVVYGSSIAAGVSPGKGGQQVHGIPVYNTVAEAREESEITAAVLFIPAPAVKDAAFENMENGVKTIVIITEHVPVHDAIDIMAYAADKGVTVVGPNTFGLISPGKCKIGIMPNQIYKPGKTGIVARSGTLSYEIANSLTAAGMGQSTVIGLGGDRIVGLSFIDVLERFEADPETEAVVLVGEIGGNAEEVASDYIRRMTKPVVAFLAGKSAPPGKRMGHAGAIIERGMGTYDGKAAALSAAGAYVAQLPWEVPELLKKAL